MATKELVAEKYIIIKFKYIELIEKKTIMRKIRRETKRFKKI